MSSMEGVPEGAYAQAASYLVGISRHFRLPITDKEAHEWVVLMTAMQPINHFLDLIHDLGEREVYASNVCLLLEYGTGNIVESQLVSTLIALHEVLGHLPKRNTAELINRLREYFALTERIKTTRRATTYANLTLKEGVVTALVLVSLLPESVQESSNYRKFYALLKHVNIVVNLWDNVKDLPGDIEDGMAQVKQTWWTYTMLIAFSLPSLLYGFTHMPPRVYPELWRVFILGLAAGRRKKDQ